MTREKCKQMLPVIISYANEGDIQYWDSVTLIGNKRGNWVTPHDSVGLGVGASISHYREIKNGIAYYFDGRESKANFNNTDF